MKNRKYKAIDKSMAVFDRVERICKKNLTDESTLEDFLDIYNQKIRKELDTERADSVKSALSILWVYGFFNLTKRLEKELNRNVKSPKDRVSLDEIKEGIFDTELEKSQKKAIKYATKNSKVVKKQGAKAVAVGVSGVTALGMVKKFTSRSKTVMNVRAVDMISKKEIVQAKKFGYKYFTFYAELDSRTTEICRNLHGTTFKVEEGKIGVNIPPMHCNCRSHCLFHN